MTIAELTERMIGESQGSLRDIRHFLKVWAYARTIGVLEQLQEEQQFLLEAAALVHDIACPMLRERYGIAEGKKQEAEGPAMVRALLENSGLTGAQIERIAFLVGHHHTPELEDGLDHRILLEADYLVNSEEKGASPEQIRNTAEKVFQTASGLRLLRAQYPDAFRSND